MSEFYCFKDVLIVLWLYILISNDYKKINKQNIIESKLFLKIINFKTDNKGCKYLGNL
jgi:hypothetical protein